ncbi:hypothetical protein QAD02_000959 [Eretmocerus hayati]|uniref:Uncharacterized protein n=2 Tax=Eretmocerus hayati TaxID=131215 RepID=A0ACC2NER8_9HYME|nr:hypothetical protein QAD02_007314 [Eretmocerus hayati]KAJ8669700.1 hypothetical protein QAD02_000959 [Eretmocerus hayati]
MSAKRENEQYIHNPSAPLTKYVMNKLKKLEKTGQIMVNSAMEEEEMFADEENDSGSDSDSESGIFGHQNMCHEVMQAESILNESSDDDSRTSDNNVTEMDTSNDADTANSTIQCSSSESRDCTLDEDEESCSEDSCDQASNAIDPSYTNSGEFDRPYDVSDARDDGLYSSDEEFDCNAEFRRFGYVDNTFDAKVAEKKLFEVIETHNTLSPACVLRLVLQFSFSNDVCFSGIVSLAHLMNVVVGSNRYPYEDNPRPMQRNDKKYLVCAKKAMETGSPCLGVRYLSPLINLYFFKMTDGLCPEYMHQYLAGCGKQITKCILKTLKPAARSLIDEYMKKIRVPTQLGRFARPLSSKALYKCLSKCWNTRVTLKAQQL